MAETTITTSPASDKPAAIDGYINYCDEYVTFVEVKRILSDLEDVAFGMRLFCESRLKSPEGMTWEESSSLAFIVLGVKNILEGLAQTIPNVQTGE